jgi:hypothetical protein
MAEQAFHNGISSADNHLRGKGRVFQRLDDLWSELFERELSISDRDILGSAWPDLMAAWATRHLLVHQDGVVDEKFLQSVPRTLLQPGQRLTAVIHGPKDVAEILCLDDGLPLPQLTRHGVVDSTTTRGR